MRHGQDKSRTRGTARPEVLGILCAFIFVYVKLLYAEMHCAPTESFPRPHFLVPLRYVPPAITSELYFARSFVSRFKTCHSALIMPNSVSRALMRIMSRRAESTLSINRARVASAAHDRNCVLKGLTEIK